MNKLALKSVQILIINVIQRSILATSNTKLKGGKIWHYQTFDSLGELLNLSSRTIKRHMKILEGLGIVISGSFNTARYDRTKWYTINNDILDMFDCRHVVTESRDLYIMNDYPESVEPKPSASPSPIPQLSTSSINPVIKLLLCWNVFDARRLVVTHGFYHAKRAVEHIESNAKVKNKGAYFRKLMMNGIFIREAA